VRSISHYSLDTVGSKGKKVVERWQPVLYKTKKGRVPATEFLDDDDTPEEVRKELMKTVLAVVEVGPPSYPTGTPRWSIMHKPKKKGEVDMSGICEARDKEGIILYRLFASSTVMRRRAA
jgi:hypothetical protein